MTVSEWIAYVDQRVWGPGMLVLLMGTGVFLTLRTRFLPWRNLGWALKSVLGRDSRAKAGGAGDVSPFSALMTTLAATIGTGNIVGVATALVAGGPGALVWMEISALFGLSSKCAECLLAVKYRQRDAGGEMRGGPMYTMCAALRWKRLGGALAFLFALFTVLASLGMGDMAQANSIAGALADSFSVPARTTGVAVALLALVVILGGIRRIAGVCSVVVPLMAVLYLLAGTAVLLGHLSALPGAVAEMFRLAFSPAAAAGGAAGTMTASALNAARWGIARGCFSHEAGMGSAAIPAASAATDSPARQGYVNMTGVFFDTTVICTVTGLCICASGVLGTADASGAQVNGVALTALAFKTVLGPLGGLLVSLGIVLFAFSTILGWEFCGETAFAFLFGRRAIPLYRILFALAAFLGATQSLEVVWNLSDIFNALMAVPNLISLLLLLAGAAEHRVDAGQDLLHLEGLDNVVVRAPLQAGHLVLGLPLGGEHDDRGRRLLPDLFQHGPAIHNGQHDVQQHQVRLEGAEILHTLSAVLGYFGLKPLLLQIEMEQLCDITVILYNKHLLGHGETLHFFIGGPGGRILPLPPGSSPLL